MFGADPAGLSDPGPRRDVAPGATVIAVVSDPGRRMVEMRWGLIPMGRRNARGRPVMETVVNARSETLFGKSAYAGVGRCLLPVSGWYEWTGAPRRKTRWAISGLAEPLLAFAAVWDAWRAPGGAEVLSLATVTCAPNADVRDIHHRMPVIVGPAGWPLWLGETAGDPFDVLNPLPDGRLRIEAVAEPVG